MADNVAVTAGTGTSIATDQIGSDHYQRMKISDATADSTNNWIIDSSGRGYVRSRPSVLRSRVVSAGLTNSTYAIGDQAGTMFSFTSAATANGGTGTILSAVLLDKADVGVDFRLHFFRSNVTLAADNAAFAVSDADMQDWCGEVVMPSLRDLGANRAASLGNIGLGYDTGAGTTLYVALETRTANGGFPNATDLNLTLTLVLD